MSHPVRTVGMHSPLLKRGLLPRPGCGRPVQGFAVSAPNSCGADGGAPARRAPVSAVWPMSMMTSDQGSHEHASGMGRGRCPQIPPPASLRPDVAGVSCRPPAVADCAGHPQFVGVVTDPITDNRHGGDFLQARHGLGEVPVVGGVDAAAEVAVVVGVRRGRHADDRERQGSEHDDLLHVPEQRAPPPQDAPLLADSLAERSIVGRAQRGPFDGGFGGANSRDVTGVCRRSREMGLVI